MFTYLKDRRFKTLKHARFLVPKKNTDDRPSQGRIDSFFRHPFTLLVAGFLLTGMLGTLLQDRIEATNKEREARQHGMDDMRQRVDAWSNAGDEYIFQLKSISWISQQKWSTSEDLDSYLKDYRASYRALHLKQRDLQDVALRRFPIFDIEFREIIAGTKSLYASMDRLNNCVDQRDSGTSHRHVPLIECSAKTGPVKLDAWEDTIKECATLIGLVVRPFPAYDYLKNMGQPDTHIYAEALASVCAQLPQ